MDSTCRWLTICSNTPRARPSRPRPRSRRACDRADSRRSSVSAICWRPRRRSVRRSNATPYGRRSSGDLRDPARPLWRVLRPRPLAGASCSSAQSPRASGTFAMPSSRPASSGPCTSAAPSCSSTRSTASTRPSRMPCCPTLKTARSSSGARPPRIPTPASLRPCCRAFGCCGWSRSHATTCEPSCNGPSRTTIAVSGSPGSPSIQPPSTPSSRAPAATLGPR